MDKVTEQALRDRAVEIKNELDGMPPIARYAYSEDAGDQGYAAELVAWRADLNDELEDIYRQLKEK